MWKNLLTLVFILYLFIACGSGGGNDAVIDADLPPDPGVAGKVDLLGIDVNNNGVRDDVEIYIAKRFTGYPNAEKEKAIAMQYARATQIILVDPQNAYNNKTYEAMDDARNCQTYYIREKTQQMDVKEYLNFSKNHDIFTAEFKDLVLNTKDRIDAYFTYNKSLSGNIFDSGRPTINHCETNINDINDSL